MSLTQTLASLTSTEYLFGEKKQHSIYVFGWMSTFPYPNLTRELLKVAVIGACLESKLGERTLNFVTFFIRDLLKTR